MKPKFNENLNKKCDSCEALLWYGKDLEYQCERYFCKDNSHFAPYIFGKRVEGKKGKKKDEEN